jgi:CBS domain-containing protein
LLFEVKPAVVARRSVLAQSNLAGPQMLREPIGHSMRDQVVMVEPDVDVLEVARLMMAREAGAVLVMRDGVLAGIFTEQDAVFRVLAAGLDPRTVRVGTVMTPQPLTIGSEATLGQAMLVMLHHGFRRLPVLENGAVVGLVTARSALDPELEELVAEQRRRESLHR